jgi:hypothetical protein
MTVKCVAERPLSSDLRRADGMDEKVDGWTGPTLSNGSLGACGS